MRTRVPRDPCKLLVLHCLSGRTITRSAAARNRRPLQRAVGRPTLAGNSTASMFHHGIVRCDELLATGLVPSVNFGHDDHDEFHLSAVPEYAAIQALGRCAGRRDEESGNVQPPLRNAGLRELVLGRRPEAITAAVTSPESHEPDPACDPPPRGRVGKIDQDAPHPEPSSSDGPPVLPTSPLDDHDDHGQHNGRRLRGTAVLFAGTCHPLRRVGDRVDAELEGFQFVPHVRVPGAAVSPACPVVVDRLLR